jgi:hypothetical protein
MKRSLTAAIASVAIAGTTLLGATAAHADPSYTISGSTGTIEDGGSVETGTLVHIAGSGCMVNGVPGVMGSFSSIDGDPLDEANAAFQAEYEPLSATGGFDVDVPADLDALTSVFSRWYCASSSTSSLTGPSVQYSSELIRVTATAGANLRSNLKRFSTTGTTSGSTVSAKSDPNSLPAVDKINITGRNAAALKSYLDGEFDKAEAKKPGSLATLNKRYVEFVYKTLSGKAAAAAKVNAQVAKLTAGKTKVKVIEDIALELNKDPKVWNTLLSTPNVKLAKRVSNVKAAIKR